MSRLGQIKQTFKSVRIEIKAFLYLYQISQNIFLFCLPEYSGWGCILKVIGT